MAEDRPQLRRRLPLGALSGCSPGLLEGFQQGLLDDPERSTLWRSPGATWSRASKARYVRDRSRSSAERGTGDVVIVSTGWDMTDRALAEAGLEPTSASREFILLRNCGRITDGHSEPERSTTFVSIGPALA
jgi:hypothetical protein